MRRLASLDPFAEQPGRSEDALGDDAVVPLERIGDIAERRLQAACRMQADGFRRRCRGEG